MKRLSRWSLLFPLITCVGMAQTSRTSPTSADLHVHSDLVLIGMLVTDSRGTPVTDLDASRFHLFEDGREQVIRSCASEDVPVSVGLVLDTSGSMTTKLAWLKSAAIQFARASNPGDEYLLIEFHQRPRVILPFTADVEQVVDAIRRLEPGGSTPLFDAVHLAVGEMRNARFARRALLIISDGMDNHSRYTGRETRRLVSEVDFPIYSVNLWQRQISGNRFAIQRRNPEILEALSTPTGGREFPVSEPRLLASVTESISSEIRQEFILGYAPSNHTLDGKFHKVRVRVEPAQKQHLKVSNRTGYYAPAQ